MLAMNLFRRYFFAYPTSSQNSQTVVKFMSIINIKVAYLQRTIISDSGYVFVSQVKKEVADILGITPEHATTKHSRTIATLERNHASLQKALIITTGEQRSMWQKYVNIAVPNYNTSCHTSIRFEPSRMFHECVSHNFLDLKIGIPPQKSSTTNS